MGQDRRLPIAVVMAAGGGTRMRSPVPKVVHVANGRPLLAYVLDALAPLDLEARVVVTSPERDEISGALARAGHDGGVRYAVQESPRGTGDAVRVALDAVGPPTGPVLVLPGDSPLVRTETLAALLDEHARGGAAATVLTAVVADPSGYGRIVRGRDGVERIVEDRDCSPDERSITEVNASTYVFDGPLLAELLPRLETDNTQGEHYLTDAIALMRRAGAGVAAVPAADPAEIAGVNSQTQLAEVAAVLRARQAMRWMEAGVTIVDPATAHIGASVELAPGAVVHPFTFLEGATRIGAGAEVGPMTRIVDSAVADEAVVTFSVVRGCDIGPGATVGPYASLRPGTRLGRGVHVGSFVETKSADIGDGSKAPHLSYLGDASIGAGVNVGAGTITCNWDGRAKHRTVIEDDAYIGADTMIVAPARIGRRAATGAGSVVRGDVPDDALAVGVPARILRGRGDRMGRGPGREPGDAGRAGSDAPQ